MSFDTFMEQNPFAPSHEEKGRMLTKRLVELTEHHSKNCPEYASMLRAQGYDPEKVQSYTDIPFLPVRLFKELELRSVPQSEVVKTMTSSGTTGQTPSRIYLDRNTASNQQKTLVRIVSDFTGQSRMPMLVIDCPSVIKDRAKFSARGAGILGFSLFGRGTVYALTDDMELDVEAVTAFMEKNRGQNILLFGFTFMIWQHFYKELVRLKAEGITFDLSNGIMIHGGGWKKLAAEAVSASEFHDRLQEICGLDRIHDYYGMVEQTGCIYMQCECGHLHASVFSDVIARRPEDFSICDINEPGILQVVSVIPESYPGHSLLTEDEGVILGEDDCPCGRKGKYFRINGRIRNAEIRGCSDTYSAPAGTGAGSAVSADTEEAKDCWQRISGRISFLLGDINTLGSMRDVPPRKPFDEGICAFLNDVSGLLTKSPLARKYTDVATYGFWLRKASISQLEKKYAGGHGGVRRGLGAAFHIAPSNVPVNFAYSLAAGLLAGNANVVRVPSKDFPQVGIIADAFRETLAGHEDIAPYLALIRYERDREINDVLSGQADIRIIWGGDSTIAELRRSPLPPRGSEITFADRFSLAVIDSDMYMAHENKERVALDFYNDTFLSDQNACTSPRLIAWMGGQIREAKEEFWRRQQEYTASRYQLQPIQGVNKLTTALIAAAKGTVTDIMTQGGNLIYRAGTDYLDENTMSYYDNSGFFLEYDCTDPMELRSICDDRRCQTITYFGDKGMLESLMTSGIHGVDRVVPMGHSMDFDLLWDGNDLITRMTREIDY